MAGERGAGLRCGQRCVRSNAYNEAVHAQCHFAVHSGGRP